MILEGAQETLRRGVFGIEVEVELNPMYERALRVPQQSAPTSSSSPAPATSSAPTTRSRPKVGRRRNSVATRTSLRGDLVELVGDRDRRQAEQHGEERLARRTARRSRASGRARRAASGGR